MSNMGLEVLVILAASIAFDLPAKMVEEALAVHLLRHFDASAVAELSQLPAFVRSGLVLALCESLSESAIDEDFAGLPAVVTKVHHTESEVFWRQACVLISNAPSCPKIGEPAGSSRAAMKASEAVAASAELQLTGDFDRRQ